MVILFGNYLNMFRFSYRYDNRKNYAETSKHPVV